MERTREPAHASQGGSVPRGAFSEVVLLTGMSV